jgi:hypothetical protein
MKTFTVTIINNETRAIDIPAESAEDARIIAEREPYKELVQAYKNRIVNAEYVIDEITENTNPMKRRTNPMKKGFAEYYILRDEDENSTGYSVRIFEIGKTGPVEEYSAGDSEHDSQVFGTGEINENRLIEMAKTTAEEMLAERGIEGEANETDE